jgi:hypothetical protein
MATKGLFRVCSRWSPRRRFAGALDVALHEQIWLAP